MTRSHFATSALILLVVLFGLTLTLPLTASVATETHSPSDSHAPPPLGLRLPEGENEARKGGLPQRERAEEEEEEEDELFGDMDPKTLAAVLLEAMNKPYGERRNGGVEDRRKEKERGEEENEGERQEEEKEKGEEVRAVLDEGADRNRDGREELELVMAAAAAQGKEERERDEEEERKRVQEEEERLTEKVTSRTTSQTIPVKEEQPPAEGERGEEVGVQEVGAREDAQQGPPTSQETQQEEQLSPEEVQNLQSMLEELQNYNTANKRERESQAQEQRGRESRGYSQDDTDQALIHNQIKPKAKGYPRAMSKKLKWQEEMQKALNMPTYRGGNFMDDFDNNLARPAAEEEDDDDDDEEMLSPEEEERRAKEEQEEVRRQAAEAQRAKAEEEKLADIASDMLLQYMVKQDKGKYQNKKTLLSNAAEDKRSDEEVSEDDDIDAQTIDKLIEMSSKLHLPADDVVDIISDVEKKKKKDAPETLPWQRPLQRPLVYPAAKAIDAQPSPPRYPTLKQPLPAINPLKAWFKDKSSIKPSNQDQNLWIKPQQKSFRTSSNYPTYPFYQQKPYRGYYPIYFPPPKPKPRYYAKPSFTLNDLLSNSLDYDFDFPPKRRYRPWVQPRPRKPPAALRRNLYYPNYSNYPNYLLPPHPRTYNPLPVPMPKPRSSPSRGQVQPRHRHGYYYQAPSAPLVTRDQDYYGMQGIGMGPQQQDSDEDLENYIQQVFMKPRPRMFQ
ncbi:trichohyalin [Coregonus clupeaformis]|uniref:trichohyalin n=1 Tax=Coregonus clupeaformis TaxID=59861 RepID=UPI001E1C87C9|nr:trichohyalin [Coregonus clupeaformis]